MRGRPPVRGGVVTGRAARRRLLERWDEFVVAGLGCRSVSDRPWVTAAESAELVIALEAAGLRPEAVEDVRAMRRRIIDSVPPHLAGALGRPVFVALGQVPDWCWLLNREDTPWYADMRLFRQDAAHDWRPIFERIATAIREKAAPTAP